MNEVPEKYHMCFFRMYSFLGVLGLTYLPMIILTVFLFNLNILRQDSSQETPDESRFLQ